MHKKTIKLGKLVVIHKMNVITVTSELFVFCPLHCKLHIPYLGSRQTRARFSKNIYFSFHTLNVFLLSSLIYVDFNLQCLEEATPHGSRPSHFKREIAFFLKVLLKYAKIEKGMLNYKTYFRMGSMFFSLFRCHIGNDITQSYSV